jgi:hypothetical protein
MNTKKYFSLIITLAMIGGFALAIPALATANQQGINFEKTQAVTGTVSAISGSTITVTAKQGFENTAATKTYTIDATNAKVTKNGVAGTISDVAVGDTVIVQGTLTGTNIVATTIRDGKNNQERADFNRMTPNIVGKVSAINGNVLTVINKQGFNKTENNKTTTFTVDATNAKILRGNTTITASNIAVGDTVVIEGTITGTNIAATMIRDGKTGNGNENDNNEALFQIQGNGQPIVAGTISTINGSTITITNDSNVTYIIDATNAKIIQGKNTISLSGVKTSDLIIVQGTVNGTSIVASTIIDQNKSVKAAQKMHAGFFGSIGQWFRHLFGF